MNTKHQTQLESLNAGRRPGRTLVVGSKTYGDKLDRRSLYEKAYGVDLLDGDGVDLVHDLELPLPVPVGKFDHVDCCSVLEHVRRPWLMSANIEAVMAPDATILVAVPFVWRIHNYPGDFWRMSHEGLQVLFPSITWLDQHYLVDKGLVSKAPAINDPDGRVWHQRCETVAFGVKRAL